MPLKAQLGASRVWPPVTECHWESGGILFCIHINTHTHLLSHLFQKFVAVPAHHGISFSFLILEKETRCLTVACTYHLCEVNKEKIFCALTLHNWEAWNWCRWFNKETGLCMWCLACQEVIMLLVSTLYFQPFFLTHLFYIDATS